MKKSFNSTAKTEKSPRSFLRRFTYYFLDGDGMLNKKIIDCASENDLPETDRHYTKKGRKKLLKLVLENLYEKFKSLHS